MNIIEIKGVPPETVVMEVGDEFRLKTAVKTSLDGAEYTGEKVVIFKVERIEQGRYIKFKLSEEPFPFGGQFMDGAIADLERQAVELRLLAKAMDNAAEDAKRRAKVLNEEVARALEARGAP